MESLHPHCDNRISPFSRLVLSSMFREVLLFENRLDNDVVSVMFCDDDDRQAL